MLKAHREEARRNKNENDKTRLVTCLAAVSIEHVAEYDARRKKSRDKYQTKLFHPRS